MDAQDPLRMVIFDFDGTLMDSQHEICRGIRSAFASEKLAAPSDDAIRRVIGLGLHDAIRQLAPGMVAAQVNRVADGFMDLFATERAAGAADAKAPLFEGARDALERLATTELLVGIATGKGRRGLDHAFETHDLHRYFTVTQTADDAPGKPHPGMVENCLKATGAAAAHAIVVGDTSYDMQMAINAGAQAIGVAWGYHEADDLRAAGAARVIESFEDLETALAELWRLESAAHFKGGAQ